MFRTPAALGCAAGALVSIASVIAQPVQFEIRPSERHQTMEGMGVMLSSISPAVQNIFAQPSFATLLRDDLGVSAVRIEVHPYIHEIEDPNPNVIDWTRFNFTWFNAEGNLLANMNAGHPGAVKPLLAFWSPPAWMKTNNYLANGGNLRVDRYAHFGKFCAAACIAFPFYFGGEPVYALSIQNEPVFVEPYLSCVYSPSQYRDTCRAVSEAMDRFGVTTKLFGSEDVGTEPPRWMSYVTALQQDPVAFARTRGLAVHHYPFNPAFGDDTNAEAWMALRDQVAPTGKPLWQTERSGEVPEWLGTPGHIKGGMYLAREIHHALKFGDVSLYLYWCICSNQPDEYGLMALDQPTTKYYAAKQFFKYIRPGAVRIGTSADATEALVSAYLHEENETMTVVLINERTTPLHVELTLDGPVTVSGFTGVRTSLTESTVSIPPVPVTAGAATITLPPSSVVTLIGPTGTAAAPALCYPNCDGSTEAPVLNVLDFTCFLGRFASGEAYANCDASTSAPILNIIDFTCYLQKFAAGCP